MQLELFFAIDSLLFKITLDSKRVEYKNFVRTPIQEAHRGRFHKICFWNTPSHATLAWLKGFVPASPRFYYKCYLHSCRKPIPGLGELESGGKEWRAKKQSEWVHQYESRNCKYLSGCDPHFM